MITYKIRFTLLNGKMKDLPRYFMLIQFKQSGARTDVQTAFHRAPLSTLRVPLMIPALQLISWWC